MAKCKVCGEPVTNGIVLHSKCWDVLMRLEWFSTQFPPATPYNGESEEEDYKWTYSDEVLVYDTFDGIQIARVVDDGDVVSWVARNGNCLDGASHWMPMPIPPEKEDT